MNNPQMKLHKKRTSILTYKNLAIGQFVTFSDSQKMRKIRDPEQR